MTPPPASRVIAATLTVVGVAAFLLLMVRFGVVLIALFTAMILAAALRPQVAWLERRGAHRMVATSAVHLLFVAVVGGLLVLAVPLFVSQLNALVADLPEHYRAMRQWLMETDSKVLHRIARSLPRAMQTASEQPSIDTLTQAFDWATIAVSWTLTTVAVLVLSFYWTLEGELTTRSVLRAVPPEHRTMAQELIAEVDAKLAAYVRGVIVCCLAVGLLAFISYTLIGLPNAFALGLIAGVLEAVPIIGPVLGAVPAAIVALAIDPSLLLWVGAATIVIQLVENYLLLPRVMDSSVGVNEIVTILAITAFGSLLGVMGAVLAIPLAAVLQVVVGRFVIRDDGGAPRPPEGRDRTSALRYEIQDLVLDLRKLVRRKEGASAELDHTEEELEAIALDLDRLLASRDDVQEQAP